ncbi:MAG TPA: branched-chain amino acid ABC transporter permease [Roseiflexaceae bacterium]|nr:branched-chain amino acid ABC transporter permease [Roseiflexaceae bacterium]
MATQAARPSVEPRVIHWRLISRIALLIFFIVFLAVPLWNLILAMAANPQLLTRQLIIGLTNGAYIALIALGYTLVYGIVELINFAHGEVYMLGAFFSLTLIGLFGVSTQTPMELRLPLMLLILLITMAFTATLNVTIERLAYRRLRNAPRLAPLISAIGVSFLLQNIGLLWGYLRFPALNGVMGSNAVAPKSYPQLIPNDNLFEGLGEQIRIRFTLKDLVVIIVSVSLLIALYLFVQRTKLGKAMRATAQDRDASALMGIDVNRTIALAFVLGGALAGAAGMLVGLYNGTAVFTMGFTAGLRSFTAAVLGGIGNIIGAMLGGLLIGVISALSDQYLSARWTNAVVFGILVIILVFRPTGLLGEDVGQKA